MEDKGEDQVQLEPVSMPTTFFSLMSANSRGELDQQYPSREESVLIP